MAASCPDPPDATRITVTNAYILPGFVDAHNHVAYNVLPRWTPPKLYQNRGAVAGAQAYKTSRSPTTCRRGKDLECEMIKYGEVKALKSAACDSRGHSETTPTRGHVQEGGPGEHPAGDLPFGVSKWMGTGDMAWRTSPTQIAWKSLAAEG